MKRQIAFLLVIALAISSIGCAASRENAEELQQTAMPLETPDQLGQSTQNAADKGFDLIGLVIHDDGSERACMTMYGFLHTAENLSYASKIYRADPSAAGMLSAVEDAIAEDVDALLVFDPSNQSNEAIARAIARGIKVVVPYYACSTEGISSNIVADDSEYYDELARGLAERMTERSLKSGRILIYGADTSECYAAFSASIAAAYPQFRVEAFNRTAADEQGAIDELAEFLLYNRDVKGMYVVDSAAGSIAIQARAQAQRIFREEGTPSPTPEPSLAPNATPVPTPNPGLLTQITITVFCNGLSGSNYDLFNDNDIYALCIEPYYEAAAEATMVLDKLLHGDAVQAVSRVNRPIVYNETADKYKAIFEQMQALFNLAG